MFRVNEICRNSLLLKSFKKLVTGLTANDKLPLFLIRQHKFVLPSTSGDNKTAINNAIDSLIATGQTNVATVLNLPEKPPKGLLKVA